MAAVSSLTEVRDPRRMACQVVIEKKHSINRPSGAVWRSPASARLT